MIELNERCSTLPHIAKRIESDDKISYLAAFARNRYVEVTRLAFERQCERISLVETRVTIGIEHCTFSNVCIERDASTMNSRTTSVACAEGSTRIDTSNPTVRIGTR